MGGLAYHVLNRAVGRSRLFEKDADYKAFERVLAEAVQRTATRIQRSRRMEALRISRWWSFLRSSCRLS